MWKKYIETNLLHGGRSTDTMNKVERFWEEHTVLSKMFMTERSSRLYVDRRFKMYPLSREKLGLYKDDYGDVILDYGCGPANDLVGFYLETDASRIIGMDVSRRALDMAKSRMALHGDNGERVELKRVRDTRPRIPLPSNSVDFINCLGVLHHTSHQLGIMQEFRRVLKPEGWMLLMIYNRMSIWYHLHVGYKQMILEKKHRRLTLQEAAAKSTDTVLCPISTFWNPHDFANRILKSVNMGGTYLGGYFAEAELETFKKHTEDAKTDIRLGVKSREFLARLSVDADGYPLYISKHAGFGAVFRLEGNAVNGGTEVEQ
jgi:SAM-dependent methyltransferase